MKNCKKCPKETDEKGTTEQAEKNKNKPEGARQAPHQFMAEITLHELMKLCLADRCSMENKYIN